MLVNMKELKKALNKLPDDVLENFYITHQMWLEDFEANIGLCYRCDEEDLEKYQALYDMKGCDVLKQFADEVNAAGIKCSIAKLDEEVAEREYCEDFPDD